jgi:DOMON domain-containing protein CG14681
VLIVINLYDLKLFAFFNTKHIQPDTFFWAGTTVRPSNIGFIVANELGRTNKLERYVNVDITIKLPDDKKITAIKWLAVWDVRTNHNHGDIFIPEGFEPPSHQVISELSQLAHNVQSGPIVIINSQTIKIPDFYYDGKGVDTFFMVGTGPQPNPSGKKIPNERG